MREYFEAFISNPQLVSAWTNMVRAAVLLCAGLPLIYWCSGRVRAYVTRRYSSQYGLIAGKSLLYAGITLIAIAVLKHFGFELNHLLGAAGIVGIAIGFAAQTSVSNLISGVFLVAEQPFKVGDVITVGGNTGVVLSIDTLSIKLRQFNNCYVRIPNETIIKSEVVNITRFPIRRVDISVGVAYKEDIKRVRELLLSIAHQEPLVLQEPEPLIIFENFGSSSLDLLFLVWTVKENWLKVKNAMMDQIKERFDREGIEIPFPHLSLYTGSATEAFPLRIEDRSARSS